MRNKGFTALKTNVFRFGSDKVRSWAPGFNFPFEPGLNVERDVLQDLQAHLAAFRDGAGDDMDLLLDLNFNAKTEGYLKILKALAEHDLFWG